MSSFILCNPSPIPDCPEEFALRVSGMIDRSNIGTPRIPISTSPPGGLRLRWNCPFLAADPAHRQGYPNRFRILRTDIIREEVLIRLDPTAGMRPRTFAPRSLWRGATGMSGVAFVAGPQPCDRADAVYFELDPRAPPVTVDLFDVSGARSVRVDLVANDRFYFEMANLHAVVFSQPPALTLPAGLPARISFLDLRVDLVALDLNPQAIAVVDARIWVAQDIQGIGQRLANSNGEPFVSISAADWDALRQSGRSTIAAHDSGVAADQAQLNQINFAAGRRWEAGLLLGWGFMDGEHPPGAGFDQINSGLMMQPGRPGVFGYQVIAEFDPIRAQPAAAIRSSAYFVSSQPLGPLSAPNVRVSSFPRVQMRNTQVVAPGRALDRPSTPPASVTEAFFCDASYMMETSDPNDEIIFTTPAASPSTLTGDAFEPIGEFAQSTSDAPLHIVGLRRILTRDYNYKIPFADSNVWLEVAVGDHWDRYLLCLPTPPQSPRLDYGGIAPQIVTATCDSKSRTVTLTLVQTPAWRADRLAQVLQGQIEFYARNPGVQQLEIQVTVSAPIAQPKGVWGAIINPAPDGSKQGQLVGGLFLVAGFTARITGFARTSNGVTVCEFEANPQCAGELLYSVQNGKAQAVLREADDAERLWVPITTTALTSAGAPVKQDQQVSISTFTSPKSSATFWFATRMKVVLAGTRYYGIFTSPVAAPYLHDRPAPPDLCLAVCELGVDYYGRSIVRLSAVDCETFDKDLQLDMVGATGGVVTAAEMARLATKGLFEPQSAFERRAVFQAFKALADTADGGGFTIGISHVRESDGAESVPSLVSFVHRDMSE